MMPNKQKEIVIVDDFTSVLKVFVITFLFSISSSIHFIVVST